MLATGVTASAMGQGETLRALTMRPVEDPRAARAKADLNTHFIYENLPQAIPLMDDFSIDRTRKRWAQPDDDAVTLTETIHRLEEGGISDPDMAFSLDTTYRYIVDITDPDDPILTVEVLPSLEVTVRDVTTYPPTEEVVTAWPPYNIFDTLQLPPADTIWLVAPDLIQDSMLVYTVAADTRIYRMNNTDTPLILWEDDDVYVNATYPVDPPTIGVATFDGVSRTGIPYNFEQYSSYGIADRLTSVAIDLERPASDSIYLSFFYQARGLSGDAQPQPQDSLVLEFYAPLEDTWYRVWRTPYPGGTTVQPFEQVMIPIKQFRYLQDGFRMRFFNYATLSGNFDHWHLDYVRLGAQRTFDDTTLVDVAYIDPEVSLLQTYTSVPFARYASAPASFMVDSLRSTRIRNLDDQDRFIVWRMRGGIDGDPLPAPPIPEYGLNTSNNANSIFLAKMPVLVPYGFIYDPSLSEDASFWRIQLIANATPDINRYNDTVTFVQELSNYYAYDDGSAEMGYGLNSAGAKLAYRYDLAAPDSLRAVRMYFNPMANEPPLIPPYQGSFLITVWSSLNPEVIIHQNYSFSSPEYRDHGLNKFVEYPLDSAIRVEGTIYVGWVQTNNANMNLGFDRNRNNQNKIFYKTGANWTQTSFSGSLMMRPVFIAAVDPFAGMDEWAAAGSVMAVFPNPVSQQFSIQVHDQPAPGARLQWVDASGRLVAEEAFLAGGTRAVPDIADGLYLLRLVDTNGSPIGVSRLILQR